VKRVKPINFLKLKAIPTMEDLTVILCAIFGFCSTFYLLTAYLKPYRCMKELRSAKRVLLVISHPDDEVMFFGPTVLGLASKAEVFLLCLSPGNYSGQGTTRKKELYASCAILGVPEQNITLIRHTKLKDNPSVRWREELVSEIVLRHVTALLVDTVVTFDRHGISGHKNHVSLYYALACLAMERSCTAVYCLTSVNLLRKYSSVVDVPMSFLLCNNVYVAGLKDWVVLHRAMAAHHSQYVWFRKIYMLFSRYALINTLEPLVVPQLKDKKEL